MAVVQIQNSMTLGISGDFKEFYRNRSVDFLKKREKFVRVLKTDKRINRQVMKESIPMPKVWPYGQPRKHTMFKDRIVEFTHRNFEDTIDVLKWDTDDEILKGDTETHLGAVTDRYVQLFDIMMADDVNGADTLGLGSVNAHDGAPLFSATDGVSAARAGVTGGNILTVGGFGHENQVIDAIFSAQQRFLNMLDTEGQPFWRDEEVDFTKMTLMCAPALNKVARRASKALSGRFDQGASTAVDNVLANTFDVWVNQRLTSTSRAALILEHDFHKPWVLVDRQQGPELFWGKMGENKSDNANEKGIETLYTHNRMGKGVLSFYSILLLSL